MVLALKIDYDIRDRKGRRPEVNTMSLNAPEKRSVPSG